MYNIINNQVNPKILLILILTVFSVSCGLTTVTAQITMGSLKEPETFSVLELISNGNQGVRLPQMDSLSRKALINSATFVAEKTGKAMGLQIFNTDTKCVETWNGTKWILQCAPAYVTYNANAGTGSDITEEAGTNCTVAGNTFTRTGHTFLYRNTQNDDLGTRYNSGVTINNITTDIKLYAQWTLK